jgi:hypothetical protein
MTLLDPQPGTKPSKLCLLALEGWNPGGRRHPFMALGEDIRLRRCTGRVRTVLGVSEGNEDLCVPRPVLRDGCI